MDSRDHQENPEPEFDFTSIIDRAGKDAWAFDVIPVPDAQIRDGFSRIPMWVADMNFATAPSIPRAIVERTAHPLFGYFNLSDAFYRAVFDWHRTRHGVSDLTRAEIGYENGVLGGLSSALRAFTSPGDGVLVHAPLYIGFTHVLDSTGRKAVVSPLVRDTEGIWRMDFDDMARKIRENDVRFAIFCSPHNPSGRVWEREEIERAMAVYAENDCVVVSDEIWSDLVLPDRGAAQDGNETQRMHIPTQSISADAKRRTIALYAPSKTFNLAGLVGSYHVIYDDYLRSRLEHEAQATHYNMPNVLWMHALEGAYSPEGARWVDELVRVLGDNVGYACDFIDKNLDGVSAAAPQGTYMLFLDCEQWCAAHGKTLDELLRAGVEVGVIWQDGRDFLGPWSIRMNLALPHALLREAFDRLDRYVFNA